MVELGPVASTHGEVNARKKGHSETPKAETTKSESEIQNGNSKRKATGEVNTIEYGGETNGNAEANYKRRGPIVMDKF